MAFLNGLPSQYESLIKTLDVLEGDGNLFTLKLIKRRLLQKEQRKEMFQKTKTETDLTRAFESRPRGFLGAAHICLHCNRRGHREAVCWDKYPSLCSNQNQSFGFKGNKQILFAEKASKSNSNDDYVWLMAHDTPSDSDPSGLINWFLDSGASSHMTPHRHLFCSFKETFSAKVVMEMSWKLRFRDVEPQFFH